MNREEVADLFLERGRDRGGHRVEVRPHLGVRAEHHPAVVVEQSREEAE